jgi:hypothetical protein
VLAVIGVEGCPDPEVVDRDSIPAVAEVALSTKTIINIDGTNQRRLVRGLIRFKGIAGPDLVVSPAIWSRTPNHGFEPPGGVDTDQSIELRGVLPAVGILLPGSLRDIGGPKAEGGYRLGDSISYAGQTTCPRGPDPPQTTSAEIPAFFAIRILSGGERWGGEAPTAWHTEGAVPGPERRPSCANPGRAGLCRPSRAGSSCLPHAPPPSRGSSPSSAGSSSRCSRGSG